MKNLQIEQIIHPVLFALSQSVPKIEQIIYPVLFALSKILGVGVGPDGGWGPLDGGATGGGQAGFGAHSTVGSGVPPGAGSGVPPGAQVEILKS